MKKLSLLLALLMILSVFITSCGDDSSDESSVTDSSEISEESSKSETENSKDENSIVTDIAVKENPASTVISNGASYTCEPGADEVYPDTYGTELTDGIRANPDAPSYGDEAFAGYTTSSGRRTIILDLGYVAENIYEFKVSYLATRDAGIAAPSSVMVYGSLDGKKWENLGRAKLPQFEENTVQEAVLTLGKYVKARYVRIFVSGSSSWFFLDEVAVIADIESSNENTEYLDAVNNAYKTLGAVARPEGNGEIDFSLTKTLISKGAKYETYSEVIDKFKDSGKMLTDGKLSGFYEGETWVGFSGEKDSTVRIDLGKTVTDIASVEASFYTNTAIKLYLPVAIKVSALDENKNKTELGVLYANTVISNGNYSFVLPFVKTISARYIEFTMYATDTSMILAEEFAVYAYREYTEESIYPPVSLETNSSDWGSKASDKYVNLVSNTTQQIISSTHLGIDSRPNNTSVNSKLMTDGKFSGNTDIHNGTFFKFNAGGGRTLIFDLQHISSVEKVTASFTQLVSWGVKAPQIIQVCVTEDGKTWYEAGIMQRYGNAENELCKYELKLPKKVKARYVSLKFSVETWAGCDEVEVFGTTSVSSAKSPKAAGLEEITNISDKRIEPSADILNGAKDTCLLYHNTSDGYKVNDLIPYLAYVDENGKMQDVMFDSFLFLFMSKFPSGGYPYSNGVKSDWEWALNDVFGDGKNIKALDEAAAQVKQELGLGSDYKYKVILSLYYPSKEITHFGDVDGDGVSEDFSKAEDVIKALDWYINLTDETFNAQNFQNIELVGYYWFHETINSDDSDSLQIINAASDMVHAKGKDFCWIPYYASNGYNSWKEYGFDVAVMQPNYVFKLDTPFTNVISCAELTALYGMGVEMEICSDSLNNLQFFKKYMQYVAGGTEFGYMNDCIIMYYQEMFAFRDACNSGSVMGRMIYDSTYHFIKGDLKYQPDAITGTAETLKDTPVSGEFEFVDDKLREFKISEMPEHGTVTINNDGSYTFYPEKGFTGEVTFSFVYSEYLGWSDNCEVVITVK